MLDSTNGRWAMFGTISHVKVKPGHEKDLEALNDEFMKTIRPSIDGPILFLRGRVHEQPDVEVAIFLCKDSAEYAKLSDAPNMDDFYRRSLEHYEGEPTWEDIRIDAVVQD
jgi:hypothetical protein